MTSMASFAVLDVQPPEVAVDGGVIEAALSAVFGKRDEAVETAWHRSAGADLLLRPGVQSVVHRQFELELALIVDAEEGKTVGDRDEAR